MSCSSMGWPSTGYADVVNHKSLERVLHPVEGGGLPNVLHNKVVRDLIGVGSLVLGVIVTIVVSTFLLAVSPPTAAATTVILSSTRSNVGPYLQLHLTFENVLHVPQPLPWFAVELLGSGAEFEAQLVSHNKAAEMQGPFSLPTCTAPPTSILHTSPHWSFS